jgi:hypothetical protein
MMTRRIETQRPGSRPLTAVLRALGPGALCATLAWQVACRGSDVPKQDELSKAATPSAEPATGATSASSPAPVRSAAVSLAKYEEPNGAPAGVTSARAAAAPGAVAPAGSASAQLAPAPAPAADAPAGKSASGEPVKGPVVADEPFQAWLQAISPVSAGAAATVEAVLVANPPYHCNPEYPHKFKLGAAPAGIAYPEATVKGMQVTPSRSVLKVPIQAQSPGKATVSGTLQFSVCDDERCLVEKRDLSLALEVK